MTHTYKRGFTLIELLVVIAIIGILAGIVLASLSTARGGANDAKVKEQLSGLRTQAEIVYGASSNKYGAATPASANCPATGLYADASIVNLLGTLPAGPTAAAVKKCAVSATFDAYAVMAPLSSSGTAGDYWCVDSTGASKIINVLDANIGTVLVTDSSCALMDAH